MLWPRVLRQRHLSRVRAVCTFSEPLLEDCRLPSPCHLCGDDDMPQWARRVDCDTSSTQGPGSRYIETVRFDAMLPTDSGSNYSTQLLHARQARWDGYLGICLSMTPRILMSPRWASALSPQAYRRLQTKNRWPQTLKTEVASPVVRHLGVTCAIADPSLITEMHYAIIEGRACLHFYLLFSVFQLCLSYIGVPCIVV
jgi:hypothetical protein